MISLTFTRCEQIYKSQVFVCSNSSIISIYSNHHSSRVSTLYLLLSYSFTNIWYNELAFLLLSHRVMNLKHLKIHLNKFWPFKDLLTVIKIPIFNIFLTTVKKEEIFQNLKNIQDSNNFFLTVWQCDSVTLRRVGPYKASSMNIFWLILWRFDLLWHRLHLGWALISLDDLSRPWLFLDTRYLTRKEEGIVSIGNDPLQSRVDRNPWKLSNTFLSWPEY